jgi:hypothetical protein
MAHVAIRKVEGEGTCKRMQTGRRITELSVVEIVPEGSEKINSRIIQ